MTWASCGGVVTTGSHSRTVECWRLSLLWQVACLMLTSNLELNSSASHQLCETLVGLACGPAPSATRQLHPPGLLTMVARQTTPARISGWAQNLSSTNFPGEQHNQESIYHSWVSGQMSLQILFALVQPNTKCYSPISGTTHLMDLTNFSLFILSYLIISDFKLWGDSLQELTYLTLFIISPTHVCLMANLVLLNLTLFLTVHFCAVHGYTATYIHVHHTCSMFPFHSATAMQLHHVFNLCYACPRQYW